MTITFFPSGIFYLQNVCFSYRIVHHSHGPILLVRKKKTPLHQSLLGCGFHNLTLFRLSTLTRANDDFFCFLQVREGGGLGGRTGAFSVVQFQINK